MTTQNTTGHGEDQGAQVVSLDAAREHRAIPAGAGGHDGTPPATPPAPLAVPVSPPAPRTGERPTRAARFSRRPCGGRTSAAPSATPPGCTGTAPATTACAAPGMRR